MYLATKLCQLGISFTWEGEPLLETGIISGNPQFHKRPEFINAIFINARPKPETGHIHDKRNEKRPDR